MIGLAMNGFFADCGYEARKKKQRKGLTPLTRYSSPSCLPCTAAYFGGTNTGLAQTSPVISNGQQVRTGMYEKCVKCQFSSCTVAIIYFVTRP